MPDTTDIAEHDDEGERKLLTDLAVPVNVEWPEWIGDKPEEIITSFEGIDIQPPEGPRFTVSETAQFFFGRTAYWLRGQEKKFIKHLPGRSDALQRYYSLTDIERVAEDLYRSGRIASERFVLAMTIVRLIGRVNDYPVGEYGKACPHCHRTMEFGEVLYLETPKKNQDGLWVHVACSEEAHEARVQRQQEERLEQLRKEAR